jgi:hypothetical protein
MKYVTSSRRQVVMAILLALAVVGAGMRHFAANPSLARDIGTLLLVLWLPAVGNLVAFGVRQWHLRARRRTDFDAALAFSPQILVRITPLGAQAPVGALDPRRCTIAVGKEGFTARTEVALSQLLADSAVPRDLPLELLRPRLALPRLPAGTPFQLLAGNVAVADGAVLRHFP